MVAKVWDFFLNVSQWQACKEIQALQGSDYVRRAAEAAAEAVGGGPEGPAALAALRAAQMGMLALKGEGLESLGGLSSQVEALRKLVLLPVRVKCFSSPWNTPRQIRIV